MSLPNGPRNSSILQSIQFLIRPLETLDNWHQQYGDTFRVLGNKLPVNIFFSSPEAIQKIFQFDSEYLTCTRKKNLLTVVLGDNSILFLNGKQHQSQKRIVMPAFHSEQIRNYSQIICEITEQAVNEWNSGKIFTVYSFMKKISFRIIINVVLGLENSTRYNEFYKVLFSLFDLFHNPFNFKSLSFLPLLIKDYVYGSLGDSFRHHREQIFQIIQALITERRMQKVYSQTDILSMLLQAYDESGNFMTDTELCDCLLTLIFAGYETVASALSWALYWSHYLPEVQEKLLSELILNRDKSEIARLPYLSAVCSETLRLHPPSLSTFSRFVQKPIDILGYHLQPGTIVNVSIYLAHQREEVYPQPKLFKPERFLERQFSPFEYLPFGGGSHRCIGAALAQLEIKLVLATILSRLELKLLTSRPLKPVRRGLIMVPPSNLEMLVTGVR